MRRGVNRGNSTFDSLVDSVAIATALACARDLYAADESASDAHPNQSNDSSEAANSADAPLLAPTANDSLGRILASDDSFWFGDDGSANHLITADGGGSSDTAAAAG